ncbi:cytochrome-ba3 oxidase subunit [Natronomonas sp.]|uniref:cytochrome-ba3 oxidase subunit n=1 Tax=Natronomonas sp. TaxID=2184060 RepID=UPI0039755FE7
MRTDSISPRAAVVVGALALAPIVWYGLTRSGTAGVFSAINVVVIIAALLVATGPTKGGDHHDHVSA